MPKLTKRADGRYQVNAVIQAFFGVNKIWNTVE